MKTKQLACKHGKTEFKSTASYSLSGDCSAWNYSEVCLECWRVVQKFDSETDYKKAIIKGLEKELKAETAKPKETGKCKRHNGL